MQKASLPGAWLICISLDEPQSSGSALGQPRPVSGEDGWSIAGSCVCWTVLLGGKSEKALEIEWVLDAFIFWHIPVLHNSEVQCLGRPINQNIFLSSEAFGHSSTLHWNGEATKLNVLVQLNPFCDFCGLINDENYHPLSFRWQIQRLVTKEFFSYFLDGFHASENAVQ